MPVLPRQRGLQRRKVGMLARFALAVVAIAGVSIGVVLHVTSPARGGRPRAAERRVAPSTSVESRVPVRQPRPSGPNIPLYTEDWLDDSGFGFAQRYSGAVADPRSLDDLRRSLEGRGRAGVSKVEAELREVDRGTPEGRARVLQLSVIAGLLCMYEGEFSAADRYFVNAQQADPACPPLMLANLEALRGVAALRRGEADNCVACCTEASCIFPLAASAIHSRPSGSREAIEHFSAYLAQRPEDLGVRWLLNIAHMTLGSYPDRVPREYLFPLQPARTDAPLNRLTNVASRVGLDARGENMAGGMIVDDFNGDGLLDVFTSTMDASRGCSLLINKGDGTFEDQSSLAGLDSQIGALNCNQADYDNDGDLDVLLLRGGWEEARRPSLLRNAGNGGFTDVTIAAGLVKPVCSQAAAWADFDNDGDVDLYIGGEYKPEQPDSRNRGKLYRNNGDGTFSDIAAAAGVLNDRRAKGVAWGDFDDDGFPDLYVSNLGQANRLYRNNGDSTFSDVAERLGLTEPINSFSCWFWDYDNDGKLDLFVTGSRATLGQVVLSQAGRQVKGERPRLYHNKGGRFTEVARQVGLDRVWLPMGSNFGDIDGDGHLDFYLATGSPPYSYLIPNVLVRGVEGRRFEDLTTESGTGHLQKGHGVAFADWDRDGDVDLFLEAGGATPGDKAHNALFQNPGHGEGRSWLAVKLVGSRSNRAAIGARVRVDVTTAEGPRSIHRVVGGTSSFGNNPLTMTIGLGQADSIEALEVSWPGGTSRQIINGLPLNSAVEITEGREGFRGLTWAPLRSP